MSILHRYGKIVNVCVNAIHCWLLTSIQLTIKFFENKTRNWFRHSALHPEMTWTRIKMLKGTCWKESWDINRIKYKSEFLSHNYAHKRNGISWYRKLIRRNTQSSNLIEHLASSNEQLTKSTNYPTEMVLYRATKINLATIAGNNRQNILDRPSNDITG